MTENMGMPTEKQVLRGDIHRLRMRIKALEEQVDTKKGIVRKIEQMNNYKADYIKKLEAENADLREQKDQLVFATELMVKELNILKEER